MKQETVRYTVRVEPADPAYPCRLYTHPSFFPELEYALLDALIPRDLDHPMMAGKAVFVSEGFGWVPHLGRPHTDDPDIFRARFK
jgi:hypothetical protein